MGAQAPTRVAPRIDSVPFRDRSFLFPADPGVTMQAVKSPAQHSRLGLVPTPSLDEVREWLVTCDTRPSLIPIYREIMADSETPVSAYARIHADKPGFILESVEGGERIARYSFIGTNPFGQIRIGDGRASVEINGESTTDEVDDPWRSSKKRSRRYQSQSVPGVQLPRFVGGAVGYLSYEAVRAFEPRVGLAAGARAWVSRRALHAGRFAAGLRQRQPHDQSRCAPQSGLATRCRDGLRRGDGRIDELVRTAPQADAGRCRSVASRSKRASRIAAG